MITNVSQMKKIVIGMSGGLDSACTALQYQNRGYRVLGVFLRMFPGQSSVEAETAAREIGISLEIIDCAESFEKKVVSPFVSEYAKGRTPNPCAFCNPSVKIGELCKYAKEHQVDKVATGHYCSTEWDAISGRWYIRGSENEKKDQSYMLWGLSQEQISMLETPLCDEDKNNIRKSARERGISAAEFSESQDICFLPNGDYGSFIENRLGKFPEGNFVDENGKILGRHKGIIHYTVGQRRGLGISAGTRLFVRKIDTVRNEVILSNEDSYCREFRVDHCVYQKEESLQEGKEYYCKVRYSARKIPVKVYRDGDTVRCESSYPIRAVTPGQSCVFYDGEQNTSGICFGGIIL